MVIYMDGQNHHNRKDVHVEFQVTNQLGIRDSVQCRVRTARIGRDRENEMMGQMEF